MTKLRFCKKNCNLWFYDKKYWLYNNKSPNFHHFNKKLIFFYKIVTFSMCRFTRKSCNFWNICYFITKMSLFWFFQKTFYSNIFVTFTTKCNVPQKSQFLSESQDFAKFAWKKLWFLDKTFPWWFYNKAVIYVNK